MQKSNQQINNEPDGNPESTPAVVAYRVGQLELTQKAGFDSLGKKLDDIVSGFVSEKELTEAKLQAVEEHKQIWDAIKEMKTNAKWWVGTIIAAAAVVIGFLSLRG